MVRLCVGRRRGIEELRQEGVELRLQLQLQLQLQRRSGRGRGLGGDGGSEGRLHPSVLLVTTIVIAALRVALRPFCILIPAAPTASPRLVALPLLSVCAPLSLLREALGRLSEWRTEQMSVHGAMQRQQRV